jgi:hypothetical protein
MLQDARESIDSALRSRHDRIFWIRAAISTLENAEDAVQRSGR